MKRPYGTRAVCSRCNHEIEWLGREHGWRDRGGGRECLPYKEKGEIVKPRGLKHRQIEGYIPTAYLAARLEALNNDSI